MRGNEYARMYEPRIMDLHMMSLVGAAAKQAWPILQSLLCVRLFLLCRLDSPSLGQTQLTSPSDITQGMSNGTGGVEIGPALVMEVKSEEELLARADEVSWLRCTVFACRAWAALPRGR